MILQTSISAEYKQCSVICSWIKQVSEFKRYFFTSSLRTVMHSTEMNKGLKEDFLRIWNVVWKLGYIRCRGGPKLYAGKRDIWCTMKIISKISSTCMSWISLHEEAPARSLKISLIRWNCKLFLATSQSIIGKLDWLRSDWLTEEFHYVPSSAFWLERVIHFIWQCVCFL